MIREARELTEGLDPNNNIFTCAGVKMPHPEPYSGEADLKRFEVFETLRITTVSGMFPVVSFPCTCYRTEDYHCVSVSYLFSLPLS